MRWKAPAETRSPSVEARSGLRCTPSAVIAPAALSGPLRESGQSHSRPRSEPLQIGTHKKPGQKNGPGWFAISTQHTFWLSAVV